MGGEENEAMVISCNYSLDNKKERRCLDIMTSLFIIDL